MPVPNLYRKSPEGAIASFDFVDLVAGVGYLTLYPLNTSAASATTERLLNRSLPSLITTSASSAALNLNITKTFEITFGKPTQIAPADLIMRVGMECSGLAIGANFHIYDIVVKKIRADASEETIGSNAGPQGYFHAGSGNASAVVTAFCALSQTAFGVGEKLSITARFFVGGGGSTNRIVKIFWDTGRGMVMAYTNVDGETTNPGGLFFYVPIKIDN